MRLVHIALYACLAFCVASSAYAQYGLYGSPEVLRMSQRNAVGQYAVPASYPSTAVSQPRQTPAPAYYQTPAQTYYQTPAQIYQPYQTVAPQPYQYVRPYAQQTPAPSYRRPARLDVAQNNEPIPAPPSAPLNNRQAVPMVPVPQAQSVADRMPLSQYDCGCGPYRGMPDQYEQAACGGCGDCSNDLYCGEGCFSPWYASVSALVMGRSLGRRLWTSYDTGDLTNQLTNTQFNMQWRWGGEVRFGRRFCCCCDPYAVEAVYWTTEAFSGHRYTTNPTPGGYVSTPLNIAPMTFNGEDARNWFDGALEHRLWRYNEFHNLEVNLIKEQLAWAGDSPWDIGWSVGVRYFRFDERLTFGSLRQGYSWGDSGGEAYFSERVKNNLVGVQVGFDAAYNIFNNVRLFITPKTGLYNNYMEQNFRAYTNNGYMGTGPYGSYPVVSSRNGIAFLTQIDVGADWQFSRRWSLRAGYRIVAATGMALADEQFPQYMVDTPDVADIQHYSSLVLHGAFCGVTYNW